MSGEQNMGMRWSGDRLIDVSFVNVPGGIHSQWQANFLQVFPVNMAELPCIHESDKKCFDDNWNGNPWYTYERFMAEFYPHIPVECYMCKSKTAQPVWIEGSNKGVWFCRRFCAHHYACGSDIT